MASTRSRLTISYAIVLLATMVAFSVALWIGRRDVSVEHIGQELGPFAFRTADDVLKLIQTAEEAGQRMIYVDSTDAAHPVIRATRRLSDRLDTEPGYFMVLEKGGKLIYTSMAMRSLSRDDQDRVLEYVLQLTDEARGAIVPVRGDSTRLLAVAKTNPLAGRDSAGLAGNPLANAHVHKVVVAIPTDVSELPPQLLLGTLVVLAPIIFIVSLVVAYFVVGNAFRPVDRLINEVEAITDGRSLHRRLPAEPGDDELSRLGATVNAMLARLESSFAALRRFTADASHELKTPLTVLRADVERAMHPATSRAERMIALEEALQETARMADLVDGLLTLARADEGRFDIYPVPVEIEPLVREIYETAVILGEEAGLELSLPTLENAVVMGDRARLRQLLLNLVTNAIKYTPRGGRVELAVVRRPNDEIAITVRDTGIGISAGDLQHIFDRFWRADRARSRGGERGVGGFGLGLSIAQWIVQAHGGTITVQSRLGRGTVFSVILPTVVGTVKAPELPAPEVNVPEGAEG